ALKAARLREHLAELGGRRTPQPPKGLLASVRHWSGRPPEAAPSGPRPRLVLMLGSSRTALGVRGQQMERQLREALDFPVVVFNFGIPAAGPLTELLTLKRLLREGLRPDLLLIEVLPPQLAGQAPVAGGELAWLPVSRLKLVDLALLERH